LQCKAAACSRRLASKLKYVKRRRWMDVQESDCGRHSMTAHLLLRPHEIYQATVEGAEIYAMEAVRMPQKYAGKEARGSRRRPWALIGAASIGLTLGNDGISKWNEGGQPYPRRKKREYWRAASGAGRCWRARGSSGEAADGCA
jgi:mannose-6-phosphate isomerase-like protein (cupin superfamily)